MSKHTLQDLTELLESYAPLDLAEDWDNVGLLVGDPNQEVSHVMVCLTITPASAAEAIQRGAQLIVTHHPLPFRPLDRLTTETTPGRLLLQLIAAGVAVYSPHTALDSARGGINQHLALGLHLAEVQPLVRLAGAVDPELGAGRWGLCRPVTTLDELAGRLKAFLRVGQLRCVGPGPQKASRVAVACGSGGSFLPAALENQCDTLITGEANFHACLEAEAAGIGLLLTGHYASERFALETLAELLAQQRPDLTIWASEQERDPLRTI